MSETSKSGVDLNMLTVLHTLLQTRNVSRAAEQLKVSQPAVSASLRRLRQYFGDELLIRRGNRFDLSPLAQQLSYRTPAALDAALRIFDASTVFNPLESRRVFTVTMADYEEVLFAPLLSRLLRGQAPHTRLSTVLITPQTTEQHPATLRAVDGALAPRGYMPGYPTLDLFQDRWVCLVDEHNEQLGDPATAEELGRLPWVGLMESTVNTTPPVRQLRAHGVDPQFEVLTTSFFAAASYVVGTRRVAVLPERLWAHFPQPGVRKVACPQIVQPVVTAFTWDPLHENDPGHRWLRVLLAEAAPPPAR